VAGLEWIQGCQTVSNDPGLFAQPPGAVYLIRGTHVYDVQHQPLRIANRPLLKAVGKAAADAARYLTSWRLATTVSTFS
jgi:hypothetical protein